MAAAAEVVTGEAVKYTDIKADKETGIAPVS
jgi:hypothetical protein